MNSKNSKVVKVESWYDRRTRNWVTQALDAGGNQIDAAEFAGTKDGRDFAETVLRIRYDLAMKLTKAHVESEHDEGHPDAGGDGYWIYLNTGWKWDGDALGAVHQIHEDTKRAAWREGVRKCNCPDCRGAQ